MKSKISGMNSLVLVLVAFSSLLAMFGVTRIDNIVHQDLYRYGLQFSYEWAIPYWTMTALVFAMGWFNIIVTSAFQFYVFLNGRKEAATQKEALRPETVHQPPIEEKPAEAVATETKETIAPPLEVELETRREHEETYVPAEEREIAEERREEAQKPVEETTLLDYTENEQRQEVEEQEEPVAPFESVEPESQPEEESQEAQEAEGQGEQEAEPRETLETGTQEPPSPAPETETETEEREETQTEDLAATEEQETSTEKPQQQEAEINEPYPT